jgi:hypothetical protein
MEKLDFESQGFVFKYKSDNLRNPNTVYTKTHHCRREDYLRAIDVIYNEQNNHVVIAKGDDETPYPDWVNLFVGYVPTQADFERLIFMVFAHL